MPSERFGIRRFYADWKETFVNGKNLRNCFIISISFFYGNKQGGGLFSYLFTLISRIPHRNFFENGYLLPEIFMLQWKKVTYSRQDKEDLAMLRIAVCDDEMEVADEVERCILKYGIEKGIDFQISKYYSGESLLRTDSCFDVVFLDIIMNKIDGIETGKAIKEGAIKTHIVYITNFTNYSMSAHKVHAFDFIEKPISYSKISDVLCDLIKYMSDGQETAEFIRAKTDNGAEMLINVDDILFSHIRNRERLQCTLLIKQIRVL